MKTLTRNNESSFQAILPEYEVREMCAPLFKKSGLMFFDYARMYDDGSCYFTSTHHDLMLHLYKNNYPLFAPIPSNLLKDKFYYFIPTTGAYSQALYDVRHYFGLGNGLLIFDSRPGYVDVSCFGTAPNNDTIHNYYLNNINILENAMSNFRNKIDSLLTSSQKNTILLPESLRLNFKSENTLLNKNNVRRIDFTSKESVSTIKNCFAETINVKMSVREAECLRYLLLGKSARETSNELQLSRRTVEHYLDLLKEKTQCRKKSELIEKAFTLLI